ncbi:unnamed protein product [Lampetra planeri]
MSGLEATSLLGCRDRAAAASAGDDARGHGGAARRWQGAQPTAAVTRTLRQADNMRATGAAGHGLGPPPSSTKARAHGPGAERSKLARVPMDCVCAPMSREAAPARRGCLLQRDARSPLQYTHLHAEAATVHSYTQSPPTVHTYTRNTRQSTATRGATYNPHLDAVDAVDAAIYSSARHCATPLHHSVPGALVGALRPAL